MQIHYSLLTVVSSVDYFLKNYLMVCWKIIAFLHEPVQMFPWVKQCIYVQKLNFGFYSFKKKSYVTKNKTKYYIGALIFNLTIIVWNWSFKCLLIWENLFNSSTELPFCFFDVST